jgi:hypothetical protein
MQTEREKFIAAQRKILRDARKSTIEQIAQAKLILDLEDELRQTRIELNHVQARLQYALHPNEPTIV